MDWIEAQSLKITILVDNYIDVFEPSTDLVKRITPGQAKKPLMAGHGYALFIEAQGKAGSRNLLIDSSHSDVMLIHNMEALGIEPDKVDSIFLTHGHVDHFGGLKGFLKSRNNGITIHTHPLSFLPKLVVTPRGRVGPWQLPKEELEKLGATFATNTGPTAVEHYFLMGGEVPRTSSFEKPWPAARIIKDGQEELDTFADEQTLVMKVEGKGLVVVAGCSHPGIINMINQARALGKEKVFAVIGGFHLGVVSPETLDNTVRTLQDSEIQLVVPCHCTSFKATMQLAEALGERLAVNCVGSSIEI